MKHQCLRGIRSLHFLGFSEEEERNYFSPLEKMSHFKKDWETVGASGALVSSPAPMLFCIQNRTDDLTDHLSYSFIFT